MKTLKIKIPLPGSDKALSQGCKCPVLDNSHGKGWMGIKGVFAMVEDCPLHGKNSKLNKK